MIQNTLFPEELPSYESKGSYYIISFDNNSILKEKTFNSFKDIVLSAEDLYPGIDKWFSSKILTGIKEGNRKIHIVIHKGEPIGEAIVKRGVQTKLCSMKILPEFQNKGIGTLLFNHIASSIKNESRAIHFTAPDSLVTEKNLYFETLGFKNVGKSNKTYRKGEDEFVFKALTKDFLWRSNKFLCDSNKDFSINNKKTPILLSLKPKFANLIIEGKKSIEIRRKFSENVEGSTVYLYSSSPIQKIIGEAKISLVLKNTPKDTWWLYNSKIGCEEKNYMEYTGDLDYVYSIFLEDIIPYKKGLSWEFFSCNFENLNRPPQSYCFVKPNKFILRENYKPILPDSAFEINRKQINLFENEIFHFKENDKFKEKKKFEISEKFFGIENNDDGKLNLIVSSKNKF